MNSNEEIQRSELISNASFFSSFPDESRADVAKLFKLENVKAGESVFLVGDPGDELYLVQSGCVEIFIRDTTGVKLALALAKPGDILGELALLDHGPRSASATALEDSVLLSLAREDFTKYVKEHPQAALDLLRIMGERLRRADDILRGHHVKNLNVVMDEKLSWVQAIVSFIADFSGSLSFLVLNAVFFVVWILWNLGYITGLAIFDPYPFSFLTMAVSLEAIFLSIFVLLAQNLEKGREQLRSDIEYDVNLRAELEISHLHTKVDLLHAEALSRLHRIERQLKAGAKIAEKAAESLTN